MKIIIIGAVAAGTSAAAKARRNDEDAQITIYEMDEHISYSGCGLPYYIGGEVEDIGELIPRDAAFFKSKYNVDILTRHEVLGVDTAKKELTVKNLADGSMFTDTYDVLILATGATTVVPPIPGVNGEYVFYPAESDPCDSHQGVCAGQKTAEGCHCRFAGLSAWKWRRTSSRQGWT